MALSASKKLVVTGAVLLALAGSSFALSYVELGPAALPVALAIAAAKASLVVQIFMELGQARSSAKIAFAAGVAMLALLLVFMVADVETRDAPPMAPTVSAAR
jgi:cytochrome c oxidase subunit 4